MVVVVPSQVWAPVLRAGEADAGLSAAWLPLVDPRGGVVAHLPGILLGGGAAQALRDGHGPLQVPAHAAASLVSAAWWDRDLRAGGLLAVMPRLAAPRRFLASGAAFRAAQRALWPRAAVLLPVRLVGGGNAPAALGQIPEAADAAARARAPEAEEDGRRAADRAAAHPGPGAPAARPPAVRARGPQQQQTPEVVSYSCPVLEITYKMKLQWLG